MSLRRLPALGLAVLLCLGVLAGPAAAQELYPLSGAITCNKSVVSPGDSVRCAADGYEAGSTVDVTATGSTTDRAGSGTVDRAASTWEFTTTVVADAAGVATATIQVPSDAVGPVSVSFSGTAPDGTPRTLRSIGAFTVVANPGSLSGDDDPAPVGDDADGAVTGDDDTSSSGGGVLSNTGAPLVMGAVAVAVLLAIGTVLVTLGRRRRRVRV